MEVRISEAVPTNEVRRELPHCERLHDVVVDGVDDT